MFRCWLPLTTSSSPCHFGFLFAFYDCSCNTRFAASPMPELWGSPADASFLQTQVWGGILLMSMASISPRWIPKPVSLNANFIFFSWNFSSFYEVFPTNLNSSSFYPQNLFSNLQNSPWCSWSLGFLLYTYTYASDHWEENVSHG